MGHVSARDVHWFLDLTESLSLQVWLDGGWAVDACLGEQTRPHSDLDIIIHQSDTPALVEALRTQGFSESLHDDTSEWNFVLGDNAGRRIDFHVVEFDENGSVKFEPVKHGESFPVERLFGTGVVGGREVACTTPQWLVRTHTGYDVDETDWADVRALCDRFGLQVPDDYQRFP